MPLFENIAEAFKGERGWRDVFEGALVYPPAGTLGGCAAMQHVPEKQEQPKLEIIPYKPTDEYRAVCGEVAKYGADYFNTCSYYADQCAEQHASAARHFELKSEGKTVSTADNFEDCQKNGIRMTKLLGIIPHTLLPKKFKWPPGTYADNFVEANSGVLDPRNPANPRIMTDTRDLFVSHRLLGQSDEIASLISGRIVDARVSRGGRKELIIIFLDFHSDGEAQQQMAYNLATLHKRGLSLVGVEGLPVNIRVEYPGCESEVSYPWLVWSADSMFVCAEKGNANVMGVEDQGDVMSATAMSMGRRVFSGFVNYDDICTALFEEMAVDDAASKRSRHMEHNLLSMMKTNKTDAAALIVGAAHLRDFQAMSDALDVNYIAVAVPAFDRSIINYIDAHHKKVAARSESDLALLNSCK